MDPYRRYFAPSNPRTIANYQRTPKVRGIISVGEFVVNIWW
jgi:hypothetical protein